MVLDLYDVLYQISTSLREDELVDSLSLTSTINDFFSHFIMIATVSQ